MEITMKVSKWGNSLAIRLPAELVEKLGVKEGDEIVEQPGFAEDNRVVLTRQKTFEEKMERLREIRKNSQLPSDYKFDRNEIYDEHMNNRWKKYE
jgi:antitoxin MazE